MSDPQALTTVAPTAEDIARARRNAFFSGGDSGKPSQFMPAKMGASLLMEHPAAKDKGGKLYAYFDNRWQSDGETFYRRRILEIMGDSWRTNQVDSTLTWINDRAAALDSTPPRDRVRVANGILRIEDEDGGDVVLDDPSVHPRTPVALPVAFDPDAECPHFDEFMRTLVSEVDRDLLQEIAGYLLTPDNSQQKAFMFQGEGGNGKSTWINIVRAVLGADNTQSYSLQQLAPDFRFNVANLDGKLANLAADISADELSSSSILRSITGGDSINGEHKGQKGFQFKPFVRLVFSANKFPSIANPTQALFDRWIVVKFDGRFRGTDREVKDLDRKVIEQELPGVLNWALDGLLRLRERGSFTKSAASTQALAQFRLKADSIAQFFEDCDELPEEGVRIERKTLFEHYRFWTQDNNLRHPLGRVQFFDRVRALGVLESKTRGVMHFVMPERVTKSE